MAADTAVASPAVLRGVPVVPGLAYGPVVLVSQEVAPDLVEAYGDGGHDDPEAALAAYATAVGAVADGYTDRSGRASGATREVLVTSAELTRDKALRQAVESRLSEGADLLAAIHGAVEQFVELFTSMGGLMAERATDLGDIERRLVARLVGAPEPGVARPDVASVLVAHDLAPADTAGLDADQVLALVTERGGATSHTAIIARQLGIPCVVGMAGALSLTAGTDVLVDATAGTLDASADPEAARRRLAEDRAERAELEAWSGPGRTADGVPVKLLVNVADGESARAGAGSPVEGVGLFRTELCFLGHRDEPSVDDQAATYGEVLEAFGDGRYVVVRTLDAGSDKPIPFASLPDEENPALGVRGLRLSRPHPELLDRQLDAIAAAAESSGVETWVMAPMVATVAEAADFAEQVRRRGLSPGVMVEVPAAALLADRILEVVDFLSIGTNDLTQYAMAADRLSADLADLTDPWQPAVLHLVAATASAASRADKPVGVCGEAAADPLLAVALVGMGITSLSMAASAVRAVGARLAGVTMETCTQAAEAVLEAADPHAAREAVRAILDG